MDRCEGGRPEGPGAAHGGMRRAARRGGGETMRADLWARVKRRLRAELGDDLYTCWFTRLELDGIGDGIARLTVPTRFLKTWIETHYADRVLALFKAECDDVVRLALSVRGAGTREPAASPARAGETSPAPSAPAAPAARRGSGAEDAGTARKARPDFAEISGNPLDQRLTFASFAIGRSNALAHAAAERISRHEGGSPLYNPLFLHAGVGLGKTHLLQAVAHIARGGGKRVIYLTADRFMYGFVAALQAQTALVFKEKLRAIDMLAIDDVQFIHGKSIQQEFGHTVNALLDAGRQIIVAGDRPPCDLEALEERVRSRLAGGLVVEMGPTDEPLRKRILETRMVAVKASHPSFEASPAVIDYVASAIASNGRDLDGAVNRLLAHATLTGSAITVETAETAIRDLVRTREPKRVKIEDIQKLVASRYNVSRSDILSERRTAAVVKPRQIAMFLAKVLTLRSLPEIGRHFGGRDHTTVLHAVRKIDKAIGDDATLKEEVDLLKRMLLD